MVQLNRVLQKIFRAKGFSLNNRRNFLRLLTHAVCDYCVLLTSYALRFEGCRMCSFHVPMQVEKVHVDVPLRQISFTLFLAVQGNTLDSLCLAFQGHSRRITKYLVTAKKLTNVSLINLNTKTKTLCKNREVNLFVKRQL